MRERGVGMAHWSFGGFLAVITAWLLAAGAFAYAMAYGALLAVLLAVTYRRLRAPSARTARLEYLYFPIAMSLAFPLMGGAVPALRCARYDDALLSLDLRLFGGSLNVWLERWTTPALTDLMCACYLLFFPLLYFSLGRYFFRHEERLGSFFAGLFTVYGLGFCGYLLVPAAGPYLAFPNVFTVPLEGGPIARATRALVEVGSTGVDVFPSLHCAVSAYILAFSYRFERREFWLLLVPVAGLWMSTLYLRYHYLIDVLCGFALAAVGVWISRRHPPSTRGHVV